MMIKETQINLNQIGYRPKDEKRAVIRDAGGDTEFDVRRCDTKESVFKGTITNGSGLGSSGDSVSYADLSALTRPGRYMVTTSSGKESYEFEIGDGVYDGALADSLRMLYLQRCGTDLPEEYAGEFAHGKCHDEIATIYGETGQMEVSGGWHDAGDYGRYTVPGAKAVADLLLAYELYPGSFDDNLGIPESNNGIKDVLDEARFELEWLHKMQLPSGCVSHKVTGLDFDGFIMPDKCTSKLYVMPASKTATADFAGVMYMAGRVYRDIDPAFSDKCIAAADRALAAYTDHRKDEGFTNPPDVLTGEYRDDCSEDEFLWAVCEGYRTTGDRRFESLLDTVDMSLIRYEGFGWDDMSGYAYYAYLAAKDPMKTKHDLKGRFYGMCDKAARTALTGEAYGSSLDDDYAWGSNMYIANNAMALLLASSLEYNKDYELAAKRQLDYILGTNPCSYCFLTGYGTNSPQNPHHRPSVAQKKAMKGMLVGGADSYLEDEWAQKALKNVPKAKCYIDVSDSYSCNEITIYWNSPLVFVLAAFR
ncbi:MAG: glycoside hydrolase family 9 protein [Lachnospiraceae bacterium]|nr:glycoside hydrolase family 9 protein [Lachnospiraceae bacterium]